MLTHCLDSTTPPRVHVPYLSLLIRIMPYSLHPPAAPMVPATPPLPIPLPPCISMSEDVLVRTLAAPSGAQVKWSRKNHRLIAIHVGYLGYNAIYKHLPLYVCSPKAGPTRCYPRPTQGCVPWLKYTPVGIPSLPPAPCHASNMGCAISPISSSHFWYDEVADTTLTLCLSALTWQHETTIHHPTPRTWLFAYWQPPRRAARVPVTLPLGCSNQKYEKVTGTSYFHFLLSWFDIV
ncbi:hypothetical protein B0T09DRAFT_181445 [Sordaria sp. MPI-SDFR-AT-0083]|nr:hypothetical protein B0T09DRAFT_181445 [Sordaria sp. MPI-SDFR-AT-0083]